ncbi:MAG: aspartyl protease family protein [Anaerolineae bacterium]|nr:aspartyl protease family protein [Anaerolineae bacterium]
MIDTGSASSIFAADQVAAPGIFPSPQDTIYRIRGVGGSEFVFTRQVDRLVAGELQVRDPMITVGAMNYGFEIYGILGMDFLLQARAMIDLHRLELLPAT